ncbi:MAG: DNA/RNA nuclease SfsA [Rhodospirillales bacterium]|nr:DNA/RNA nuclease SfsA [Rhodospirillales bacterium]
MKFPDPLLRGRLVKRYKRFLADIELVDGTAITAHCANPGSMLGLTEPGSEVWVSPANNPKRKLKYTWELIRIGRSLVGLNTNIANKLAWEALENGVIGELTGFGEMRSEVKYGKNSRIDILLLGGAAPKCFVEVKSVTLKRGDYAEFPDSVTARGTKHLSELADQVAGGQRAVMLYIIQREDADEFAVAGDIDPAYEQALGHALKAGVETLCYKCRLSPEEIVIEAPVPMRKPGP